MRDGLARAALALAVSVAWFALTVGGAAAAPKDGQKFGDWIARCGKEKDGKCVLVQTQVVEGGARLLEATIGKIGTKGEFGLVAIVPLGIHLPSGVAVLVDEEQFPLSILKCLQDGCQAVMELDGAKLAKVRKAKGLVLGVVEEAGRKTITMPISVSGLDDGLTAIK
ncbi:MAG: invasion associated locus B family protein [Alphaproteobacteria bacterium]|nr:invasion associated locus B family protein [Alphaproteobacteria bacterium]